MTKTAHTLIRSAALTEWMPRTTLSLVCAVLLLASACSVADELPRTVTVSGSATATAEPDSASLRMSIVARDPKLDVAQNAAARVTNAVLKLTDSLDIARRKVDTTGANVRPDYRWNPEKQEQVLRGYIAERSMIVTVDDLELLGKLIEGAVAVGVNQVSPPQLQSSKKDEAQREALRLAALDARANAAVLAEALGAKLGDAVTISSVANAPVPYQPAVRMATASAMESDAASSYNPAELTFATNVTVVFELID